MNSSGVEPLEYKVLVKPDQVQTVSESGLILMTEIHADREALAQTKGTIVAVGSLAFDGWGTKPNVGDRVYYAKFHGQMTKGDDGLFYTVMHDKDIIGLLSK